MTEKHRKMLIRILVTFVLFIVLMIMDHSGIFSWMDEFPGGFFLYLVPYLLIGYDIIWKAARNIRNGQVFDENFLMMVATFAAFGVGEYSEALEYFETAYDQDNYDKAFEYTREEFLRENFTIIIVIILVLIIWFIVLKIIHKKGIYLIKKKAKEGK